MISAVPPRRSRSSNDAAGGVVEDEDRVRRAAFGRGLDGESDLDQRAGEQQTVAFEGRMGFDSSSDIACAPEKRWCV
jgi:hypothetical protein